MITNSEMGDKFDIQSVDSSNAKYKVTVFDGGKNIYSEVTESSLNDVILLKICNLKSAIEDGISKAYHDKYLKDKIFVLQMPVNNHTELKEIGVYMDVASLALFEFIAFEDSDIMDYKAIYVDVNRIRRQDRGYLAQQDGYASSMGSHFNKKPRKKFKIEDGCIVANGAKYRYIASENVLYEEKTKLKLKAISFSEFEKNLNDIVKNKALFGLVYGTKSMKK